jgi:hypothetical protein
MVMPSSDAEVVREKTGCARSLINEKCYRVKVAAFKENINAGRYNIKEARLPRGMVTVKGEPRGDRRICESWVGIAKLPFTCWACVARKLHWCAETKKEEFRATDEVLCERRRHLPSSVGVTLIRFNEGALRHDQQAEQDFLTVYSTLLRGALLANGVEFSEVALHNILKDKWKSMRPIEKERYLVSRTRIVLHFLPQVATVELTEDEQVVSPPAKMARTSLTGPRLGGKVKPMPNTPMSDVPDRRGEFQAPLPRSTVDMKLKEIDRNENYEFYDYFVEKDNDSHTILRKLSPEATQRETGRNEIKVKEEVRNLKRSFDDEMNFYENYCISAIDDFLPDDGCTQGTSASRLCHQQSHGLQAQLGASALAGPVRGLQGDHKTKEDGLVAAATTMTMS